MSGLPYIRWNPADYFKDAHHLNRSQHGAYYLLLMAMWSAGGRLPSHPKRLARLALATDAEWAELRPVIMPFFRRDGAFITHKRISAEIDHARSVSESRQRAGQTGVQKKRSRNNGSPPANGKQMKSNSEAIVPILETPTEEEALKSFSSDRSARAKPSPAERQASPDAPFDVEAWKAVQLAKLTTGVEAEAHVDAA